MTVFFHIGSHKTGTTAIQDFAATHREWLRGQGLLYPSFDLIGGARARSHLGFVDTLIKARTVQPEDDPVRLLDAARRIAEDSSADLLFSAESLFRLPKGAVSRACDAFRQAFPDTPIVVVCALRPQVEFAESLYRNSIRAYVRPPTDFETWLANSTKRFDYAQIVTGFLEGLQARPLLMPYSYETRATFVEDFFAALGVPVDRTNTEVRQKNPSLDAVDCLAKEMVLGTTPDERVSKAFNNFAFRNPVPTEYAFLGRGLEAAFLDSLGDGNDRLTALEPALKSVLGQEVPRLDKDDIDDACRDMARKRTEAFLSVRSLD